MSGKPEWLKFTDFESYQKCRDIPIIEIAITALHWWDHILKCYILCLGYRGDSARDFKYMDKDVLYVFLRETGNNLTLNMYDSLTSFYETVIRICRYSKARDTKKNRNKLWLLYVELKEIEFFEIEKRFIANFPDIDYHTLYQKAYLNPSVELNEVKTDSIQAQKQPETIDSRPFFLNLLEIDSPGAYKAIQKGIDSGRIRITPEGKLDFQFITKGTLAHIFKTGGYTDWSRVIGNVLIDGREITGSLKNLAAIEPPKGFEEIKKELYPN